MGLEAGGRGGMENKEKEEKEEVKISHMCESIGHRPLRGRCPKRKETNTYMNTYRHKYTETAL